MTVQSQETNSGTEWHATQGPNYLPAKIQVDVGPRDTTLIVLDEYGKKGWEVFDVRETADWSTYYLKRRK